ncbi:YjbF family lipoprotein [Rheinheimera sp.]|uniref:YjbF family lipoprotein n=1 Tax=Rheinheimera sp. TaxID=1869214 RepID=UPI003AF58625
MVIFRLCLLALTFSSLVSCTSTYKNYAYSFEQAFFPDSGVNLTADEIAAQKYDVLYVTSGNRPRALVVLAYVEQDDRKWVSNDKAMLVTRNGRVVKTAGFSTDLVYSEATVADPLQHQALELRQGLSWNSLSDWSSGDSSVQTSYRISDVQAETLEIAGMSLPTRKVTEQVTFGNGQTAENVFWLDPSSGQVLKSLQYIAPFFSPLLIEHVTAAAKLQALTKQGEA